MGSPVRPLPSTPDDAAFQAWKAQQSTPDDSAFQSWKARQRVPAAGVSDATDTSHPGKPSGALDKLGNLGMGLYHGVVDPVATGLTELAGPGQLNAQAAYDKAHPTQSKWMPRVASDPVGRIAAPLEIAASVSPIASMTEKALGGGLAAKGAGMALQGAAVGATGDPHHPIAGGIAGGLLAPALGLAGMGAAKLGGAVKSLATSAATRAAPAADAQLAHAIGSDGGVESVLSNARKDWSLTPAGQSPLLATSAGPEVNNSVHQATSIPGQSGYTLAQKIQAAKAGEGGMVKSAMQDAAGTSPTSAYQATKAITGQQNVSMHRLYGLLEGQTVDDPEIVAEIRSNPALSAALSSAFDIAKEHGYAGENPITSALPAGTDPTQAYIEAMVTKFGATPESAARQAAANPAGVAQYAAQDLPSGSIPLSVINHMKQGADEVVTQRMATDKTFTKANGRQLRAVVQSVIEKVDAQHPEFANARMVAANDYARRDAVNAGAEAVTGSKPAEQMVDEMKGLRGDPKNTDITLNPVATQNLPDYKTGAVSAYGAKIDALSPESNVSQLFNSPEDLSRVHAILGDEGMQTFNDALNSGKRVEATASRVASNPASQADAMKQNYGPGNQPVMASNPMYAARQFFRNLHAKRQEAFQTALGDALAKRLALDPTGAEGAQFFQKVSSILDKQSATKIAARAQMAMQRMKATAGFAGILAAKGGKPQ